MLIRLLMLCITILPLTSQVEAGVWDSVKGVFTSQPKAPPPAISVLIVQDQPGVMMEVRGKYHVYDPNTNEHLTLRPLGNRKFLQPLATGLRWGEEFPGIYQILILPEDPNTAVVINGIEYKGSFYVYDVGGNISIINKVDIEEFLKATLKNQFADPLPEEALAAIAITARTNAYYRSNHPLNSFWALDAERAGYEGVVSENDQVPIINAINQTKYMVMSQTGTYEGKVTAFPAQWGSMTGGQAGKDQAVFSRITLFDAEEMGRRGDDAAQILLKAFPSTHIELIY